MAKVCHGCRKGPAFGHSRSHSMVATKRRFNPNLQKVRILVERRAHARLRLHPLPQGRQGHQGRLAGLPSGVAADTNLARFRAVVAAALAHLEARRQEVNDLNVFPVADGDTGDNMALTLRAVLAELDRLVAEQQDRTIDEIGRDEIVDAVARAALLGARGNSGVILSQFIRGAAEELVSRPGELVDPTLVGSAMARSVDRAYDSVRDARRGHDPHRRARHGPPDRHRARAHARPAAGRRTRPTTAAGRARSPTCSSARSRPARSRCARTPDLLPVLREAGVVDAGGYALTVIFAGVIAALRGTERRRSSTTPRRRASPTPSTRRRPTATARTSRSPATDLDAAPLARARSRRSATRSSSSATRTR